ncbi:type II toxin-antitoxin system VapC family toxin [Microbacterium sp. Mu-80]|uniref:Ribonuclease VapC n=1 Tax=Microbacterium bandirmense TaxID=3122050 RepID=A0ABU8LD61_9MICO
MIYLDSCILIYLVEDGGERGARVREALRRTTDLVAVSDLVLHECLIKPLRDGNLEMRDRFFAAFERFNRVDLDVHAYVRAAEIRAKHGLRAPDALHLAAAQQSGCAALWTNDHRFAAAARGLSVNVLDS